VWQVGGERGAPGGHLRLTPQRPLTIAGVSRDRWYVQIDTRNSIPIRDTTRVYTISSLGYGASVKRLLLPPQTLRGLLPRCCATAATVDMRRIRIARRCVDAARFD
jgi:hypothetical protein